MTYDADGNRVRLEEFDPSDVLTMYFTYAYRRGAPMPNSWISA